MINYRLAAGKYRPAKTPYLDTFHAVTRRFTNHSITSYQQRD